MVTAKTAPPPSPSLPSTTGTTATTTTGSVLSEKRAGNRAGLPESSSIAVGMPERLAPLAEERIFEKLRECDPIRYAAYRTAVKLVRVIF